MKKPYGFSLIELVMVIVLMAVLMAVIGPLTAHPFQAYADLQRRAQLVTLAENALQLMERDIHQALPNSLRVNGTAFELIHVQSAGRYRAYASVLPGSDTLDFTQPDAGFQVAGSFAAPPSGTRLVIYHTGQTGANAYAGDAVITPTTTSITSTPGANESLITLSSPWQFPFTSPLQRFYIVDTPITYRCNGNQLLRYDNYAIQLAAASPPNGARSALVSDLISSCSFAFSPGTAQRAGVITLSLSLSSAGEQVSLLKEVSLANGI